MNDRGYAMSSDNVTDEGSVARTARHEGHRRRYQESKPVRKIVENHDRLVGIGELMNHVAADVACTPCDQNRHIKRFS
jgi:hypothetical protein